jgi:DNA polymerase III subunit epsilon
MAMNEMLQFFRQMSGKLGSSIYAGVQGQTNPQHIAFIRELQKEMKQKNNLELPLEDLQVVVFDLETTGFYPEKGDQIISIGAIKMIGDHIKNDEIFYSLVKTNVPLSTEISTLTNIHEEDLRTASEPQTVLMDFLKYIGSNILVAHHAKHEQVFMQKVIKEWTRTKFEHRIVDTSFLFRLTDPHIKSLTLEDICVQCGVVVNNRHHALQDAIMTAQVWGFLLKKAKELGLKNLREVYEHIAKSR